MSNQNQSFESQTIDLEDSIAQKPVTKKTPSKKSAGAFRTISEVADELEVQQHVLRFWETKFSQVRPLKRGGGRRYYRPEDVELLKRIHELLYTEGYTIKGVQKLLRQQGKNKVIQKVAANAEVQHDTIENASPTPQKSETEKSKEVLEIMLAELKALRAMLKD